MAKKKKGTEPSKEEASLAMESIKALQKANDEDSAKKQAEEEERKRQEAIALAEKMQIELAQEKIKRVLRENLKKKHALDKESSIKKFLESGDKVKWKSLNNGARLQGYVKNKMIFEITKGLMLFSLYIKDKSFMEEKKLPSYLGCSTTLQKLKSKSEKLI
jgi:hypothetical protein